MSISAWRQGRSPAVAGRTGAGKSTLGAGRGRLHPAGGPGEGRRLGRRRRDRGHHRAGWPTWRATSALFSRRPRLSYPPRSQRCARSSPLGWRTWPCRETRWMGASTQCSIGWASPPRRSRAAGAVRRRATARGVASVLVMGTRLIVLDEPAAQLDPGGTRRSPTLLRELAADGRAVLVAEHAPERSRGRRRMPRPGAGRVVARGRAGRGPWSPAHTRPRWSGSPRPRRFAGAGVRREGGGRCPAARPAEPGTQRRRLKSRRRFRRPGDRQRSNTRFRPSLPRRRGSCPRRRPDDRAWRERGHRRPERVGQNDAGQAFQRPVARR